MLDSLKNLSLDKVKNLSTEIIEQQKEKVDSVKTLSVDKIKQSSSNIQDAVADKIAQYMKDIKIITPIMNKMGYEINEVEIEVALIPKIIPHFNRHTIVKVEIQEKVLAYCKEKNLPTLILSALVEASKIQNKMNLGKLKFTELEMELGIIPSVKMKFTNS
ncbi:MAG: hypothetical protein U9Q33_00595 [Campylobacterota bacterium]|nr:hypothetical protein [Campylobacterota bacterium]